MNTLKVTALLASIFLFILQVEKAQAFTMDVDAVGGMALSTMSWSETNTFGVPGGGATPAASYANSLAVKGGSNCTGCATGGLYTHYRLPGKEYGLSLGLLYTEFGGNLKTFSPGPRTTQDFTMKMPYFNFPLTLDYWALDWLAFGGGVYYAVAAGNIKIDGQTNYATSLSSSASFDANKFKPADYGLAVHASAKYFFNDKWYGTGHFVFQYGLENVNNSGSGTANNQTGLFMVGLGYRI